MLDLKKGRQALIETQTSLGVRAGCQLWERFIAIEHGGPVSFELFHQLTPELCALQAASHRAGPRLLQ
jgi:hypothetical protein